MADLDRIKRNVAKMAGMNAPESDIDGYIASEGVSIDQVRDHTIGSDLIKPDDSNFAKTAKTIGGMGQRAGDMLSGGLFDEAQGGIDAAGTFAGANAANIINYALGRKDKVVDPIAEAGRAYNEKAQSVRDLNQNFGSENPVPAFIGDAAGGIVGGVGLTRLAARHAPKALGAVLNPSTLRGKSLVGAATGAGSGYAYGFGSGEGGYEARKENARSVRNLGAGFGAVLPPAVAALSRVAKPALKPLANKILNSRQAAEQSVESVVESPSSQPTSSLASAERQIGASLPEDFDFGAAIRELSDSRKNKTPVALADISGADFKGQVRGLAGRSGSARDIITKRLDDRASGAVDRTYQELTRSISPVGKYFQHVDEIISERAGKAKNFYDRAFGVRESGIVSNSNAQGILIKDPVVDSLIKDHTMVKNALATARKEIADDMLVGGYKQGAIGSLGKLPNNHIIVLDSVKKKLNQTAREAYRAGRNNDGRRASEAADYLTSTLKRQNPRYRQALKIYADDSKVLGAVEDGRIYDRLRPEEIARKMKDMSASEVEAFKVGVRENLQKKIGRVRLGSGDNGSTDPVKKIFGSKDQRDQLREVFRSKEEFGAFEERLKAEIRGFETKANIIGGSNSDLNIAKLGLNKLAVAMQQIRGGKSEVLKKISEKLGQVDDKTAKEIADIVTDFESDKAVRVLQRIKRDRKLQKILKEIAEDQSFGGAIDPAFSSGIGGGYFGVSVGN